ncbi:MAG: hypothetical protein NTX75_02365 [Proteobacteria bacterium]|nr:hypothetical protein [Pseudomonadota bacterium]
MRITDSLRYQLFQSSISNVQKMLDDIERKISTQKKVNVPSDDALSFSKNIELDANVSIYGQFNKNMEQSKTLGSMYGTSYESIGNQLDILYKEANAYGTMDDDLKRAAGVEVEGIIEHLITIGNTKLGNNYIFGGKQADVPPFQLNNDYSVGFNVSQQAEEATKIYIDKAQTGKYGVSGRTAFYDTSKIAFGRVANTYTGDIYSNTDKFAYVIDATNNKIFLNGAAVTLTSGVYTGGGLAKEIQSKIGVTYSAGFDSTTRKFVITNNTDAAVTFNWSDAGATARSVLGFDNIDSVIASGKTETSDIDTGRKSFLVETTTAGATTGALGARAVYRYSLDGGATWTAGVTVNTGGADETTADITIDATNNTLYRNGVAITLASGTYTGDSETFPATSLATEIQTKLNAVQAGHIVTYDALTRKFNITNNTGDVVNFNWSNTGATAAGVLGFDNVDSALSNGTADVSDYDAGMFIDGAGVVNTTNNRIKLLFSTTGNLVAGGTPDTFEVKDLSTFELLKNYKDAFESGNTEWVSKNLKNLQSARELTTKNAAVVAFSGVQADNLIADNKLRDARIAETQSKLMDADMTELATQFNALLNTYQAMLSVLAKMQSISILNYLK